VPDKGIRVTAVDLETGETREVVIKSGNYVITAAAPCHVAGEQHYDNGTTVLTLKGRSRGLMGLAEVRLEASDG
jgi:hypothetical protein